MKGTLQVLAGSAVLLAGLAVTWLVASSSYFLTCRLAVEVDRYTCWALSAVPLGVGVGSAALGGILLIRSAFSFTLPRRLRVLQSGKGIFLIGLSSISALWLAGLMLFIWYFTLGIIFRTLLFLVLSGLLFSLGLEWVRTYEESGLDRPLTMDMRSE